MMPEQERAEARKALEEFKSIVSRSTTVFVAEGERGKGIAVSKELLLDIAGRFVDSLDREEQLIADNERLKKELFQARNERWEYEKGMSETHCLLSAATQGLEWYANEIIWIQGRYEGGVFFTVAEDDKGDQARAILKQINQS